MDEDKVEILETDTPAVAALVREVNSRMSEYRWIQNGIDDTKKRLEERENALTSTAAIIKQLDETIELLRSVKA